MYEYQPGTQADAPCRAPAQHHDARDPRTARSPAPFARGVRPTPAQLLALQRGAGNAAVQRALQDARHVHDAGCGHDAGSGPDAVVQQSVVQQSAGAELDVQAYPSAPAVDVPVQRAYKGSPYVTYGGLNNGSGTSMHAELHPGQLGTGSVPSVRPPWWPTGTGATAQWFSRFMVQGHLLNHNVGGPGNTMSNLTPLAKSANSAHHSKVEREVKNEVLTSNRIVEYYVEADYGKHPTGADLGASGTVETDIDTNYSAKMAHMIHAEYTVYDTTGKELRGDAWEIYNNR